MALASAAVLPTIAVLTNRTVDSGRNGNSSSQTPPATGAELPAIVLFSTVKDCEVAAMPPPCRPALLPAISELTIRFCDVGLSNGWKYTPPPAAVVLLPTIFDSMICTPPLLTSTPPACGPSLTPGGLGESLPVTSE